MLEPGDVAPDFTLPDQDGRDVTLSDLRGTPVLVYFYPRDFTPGCTQQACDVRDRWAEFGQAGITVLGVSPDTVEEHARFRDEHDLPHTLLADPDHEVMEPWGGWGEKNNYGNVVTGAIRSAVLLDAEGVVVKRWKRIGAAQAADRVLAAAADLL